MHKDMKCDNLLTLLQYGHSPNMMLKLCLLVISPLNHLRYFKKKKRKGAVLE